MQSYPTKEKPIGPRYDNLSLAVTADCTRDVWFSDQGGPQFIPRFPGEFDVPITTLNTNSNASADTQMKSTSDANVSQKASLTKALESWQPDLQYDNDAIAHAKKVADWELKLKSVEGRKEAHLAVERWKARAGTGKSVRKGFADLERRFRRSGGISRAAEPWMDGTGSGNGPRVSVGWA